MFTKLKHNLAAVALALAMFLSPLCGLLSCVTTDGVMVVAEKTLYAGSTALDVAVATRVEKCRSFNLETEQARLACVESVDNAVTAAEPAIRASVAALRAYWTARAAGDESGMTQAVLAFQEAAKGLPPDFFSGLIPPR